MSMNVKTQSPVYINKKKVSNGDFYVSADGPYAPGYVPGSDTLPNSPLMPRTAAATSKKIDASSIVNKGYLGGALDFLKGRKKGKDTLPVVDSTTVVNNTSPKGGKAGMSTTAKVGIVAGVLALVALVYFGVKGKKK